MNADYFVAARTSIFRRSGRRTGGGGETAVAMPMASTSYQSYSPDRILELFHPIILISFLGGVKLWHFPYSPATINHKLLIFRHRKHLPKQFPKVGSVVQVAVRHHDEGTFRA